jgi:DNA polymerase IIIc chi subunit
MTSKEKQRELIIEIMKADEESGLYDEPSRKQTAVDLLFDALWTAPKDKFVWHSILKKAKELEKSGIIIAHIQGAIKNNKKEYQSGEQYYKETYGKDDLT